MISTLKIPYSNFGIDLTLPLNECSSSQLIKNMSTSHSLLRHLRNQNQLYSRKEFEQVFWLRRQKIHPKKLSSSLPLWWTMGLPASQDGYNLILKIFLTALSVHVLKRPPIGPERFFLCRYKYLQLHPRLPVMNNTKMRQPPGLLLLQNLPGTFKIGRCKTSCRRKSPDST